jgi:hypothetical protein
MKQLLAIAIALGLSVSVAAQWGPHVRPDVPRNPDGTVNLNAPPPRLANGRPDFSGTWESRTPTPQRFGAPSLPNLGEGPPVAAFVDVERPFKGGLPLTPWARELKKQRMATNSMENPDAHCLPMGFMQMHTHSQPRRAIHTPNELVILYEANYGQRSIFTDGRSLPDDDPQPWWDGYSVGRWEGDELVVQTIGFRGDGWLDVNGTPFSEELKLTERFRRVNYGRIEIDLTIDDPKAYTMPWTIRVNWRLSPDDSLIEFICNENERSSKHYTK